MAHSTAWKAWERLVAGVLNGQRRGCDTSDRGGDGKSDVIHNFLAPECKLLANPTRGDVLGALAQAIRQGEREGRIPCAVVNKKGEPWHDAMVIMRLEDFRDLVRAVKVPDCECCKSIWDTSPDCPRQLRIPG